MGNWFKRHWDIVVGILLVSLFAWYAIWFAGHLKEELVEAGGLRGIVIDVGRYVREIVQEIMKD